MFRKATLAIVSAAILGLGLAPAAQAKTNLNIGIGFGVVGDAGAIYVGQPVYYDDGYGWADDDCHYVTVKHKKWNASHTKKITYYSKKLVCN